MNMKFVKQFGVWFEVRNDQRTARKAWPDYIVDRYLNQLDLTCDRKQNNFQHSGEVKCLKAPDSCQRKVQASFNGRSKKLKT